MQNKMNRFKPLLPSAFILGLVFTFSLTACVSERNVTQKELIQRPLLNAELNTEDFAFPSRPPRLSKGKVIFEQNCNTCHAGISYDKIKDEKPIDTYLMLTRGDKGHPKFPKLTRDQRWEALFYARHLAGESDIQNKEIAAIFGANCAVCHGSKGFADGPLHSGHASAHELGMAPVKGAFNPPPANFHSYYRMYNRTNDILVKNIKEGLYPSGMPAWDGVYDKDKNVTFDDALILDLVKYIRGFAIENDLSAEEESKPNAEQKGGDKEISALPKNSGKMEN